MADDKKKTIIIKKVKRGGDHGGAHGGAWKVAYADFVTAMMCFFLVMWLMATDDSTKAAIAAYFNDPNSPEAWRPDLHDRETIPLGVETGAGQSVLKGADGQVPEDLVQRPREVIQRKPDSRGSVDSEGNLSREDIAAVDSLTYSFVESELFKTDLPELSLARAEKPFRKIRKVAYNFNGRLLIRGTHNESISSDYEQQMSRLVAAKQYMVDHRWQPEEMIDLRLDRAQPSGDPASQAERRYEFIFSRSK